MSTFKDIKGNEYIIIITVGSAEDVKNRIKDGNHLPVDLFAVVQKGELNAFLEDIPLMINTLYVLLEDQIKEYGLTDVQFGRSLGGPQIEEATAAFLEALVNFSPNVKHRTMLREIIAKHEELQEMSLQKTRTRMGRLIQEMAPVIDRELDSVTVEKAIEEAKRTKAKKPIGGDTSITVPESSESTPAPSV